MLCFFRSMFRKYHISLEKIKLQGIKLQIADFKQFVSYNRLQLLTSVNSPIPYNYKPVTCDPPTNVTNGRIINGIKINDIYLAKSEVECKCLNETFRMEGTNTITCLYSGHSYKIPRCKRRDKGSTPLSIVLPLLLIVMILFMLTMYQEDMHVQRISS